MPFKDKEKQKAAQRRYYEENKVKYDERSRKKNSYIRRHLIEVKESTPCVDCKIQYPHYIMDFDHVRGEKKFNIGGNKRSLTLRTLQEELDKCEVVCANCHRHRTFMRSSKTNHEHI